MYENTQKIHTVSFTLKAPNALEVVVYMSARLFLPRLFIHLLSIYLSIYLPTYLLAYYTNFPQLSDT